MSPRTKTITLNLGAVVGAIAGVTTAVWGGGSKVVTFADARYVRVDSYTVQRQRDSLNKLASDHAIVAILMGLDSSDRCRRGQSGSCR